MKLRTTTLLALVFSTVGQAQVPTYRLETIAPFDTTSVLNGASDAGHLVGWRLVGGVPRAFVAQPGAGIVVLPLPPGYTSSAAFDANDAGMIVGTAATNGFALDVGEPAIWTPNSQGGYDVVIPQQFTSLPGPQGPLQVRGGIAVGVNNLGTIIGWSRYQGFQGGPTTRFFSSGPPVNVDALGFNATVRAINDHNVIVGDARRMNLDTGVTTSLGLPPPLGAGGGSFQFVRAHAVNDADETVLAAALSTSQPNIYLTYRHSDAGGFVRHNPSALPSVFQGRYDNNDRGDVLASGGLYFAREDVLVTSLGALLDVGSTGWLPAIGYIDDDRRIITTAVRASDNSTWLVWMVPVEVGEAVCGPAVPNGSGAPATIVARGSSYSASNLLTLEAASMPASTFGYFLVSTTLQPVAQPGGSAGVLCLGGALGRYSANVLNSGVNGSFELALELTMVPTPTGPVAVQPGETWLFQAWFRDGFSSNFTDARRITFD